MSVVGVIGAFSIEAVDGGDNVVVVAGVVAGVDGVVVFSDAISGSVVVPFIVELSTAVVTNVWSSWVLNDIR